MAQSLELPISGLASDPGPFTAAPPGALYEAYNVICRRPGVLEPRGGFIVRPDSAMAGRVSLHVFAFAGSRYNVSSDLIRQDEDTTITGPTSCTLGKTWSTVAQGRALLTTDQGVFVIDNATTTTARRAGQSVPEGFAAYALVHGTAAKNWLAATNWVAYRVVYVRRSDGTPVQGAPSNFVLVQNNQAGAGYVRLGLCSTFLTDGDEIQIYRTSASASAVTEIAQMRLRAVLTIATGGAYAPNTSFTWDDFLSDSAWAGEALYTSPTQQGSALSNFRPHYADDVVSYAGMAFFVGHKSPHRVVLNMRDFGTLTGGGDQSTAFCSRTDLCTTTAGSAVVATGFDPSTSYFIGQVVTLPFSGGGRPGIADATFQADSRITAIGPGNQFTMSKTALTTGGVGFVGWDWIACERGATRQVIYAMADASSTFPNTTGTNRFLVVDDTAATGAMGGAQDAMRAWSEGYVGTANQKFRMYTLGARDTNVQLVFEALTPSDASFVVKSTKPLAFDRLCDATTGITSTQDGGPHRLAWSKVGLPETAPLPYVKDVVPEGESIYRGLVCRDSLWLFTSVGVYRVTATDATSVSVMPFDSTAILAQRQLVAVAHDALWAWTGRGILRITDGGDERIDLPIARLTDGIGATLNLPWVLASHDHGFVAFGSAPGLDYWSAYVFCTKTGTWSTWGNDGSGTPIVTCASEGDDGALLLGDSLIGGTVYYQFADSDAESNQSSVPPKSFDGRGLSTEWITVTNVTGTTVTIAGGGYSPRVGDAIAQSSLIRAYIVSVTNSTVFEIAGTLGTGSAAALQAFDVSVKWVARAEGNVGADKFWTQLTLPLERLRLGRTISFDYASFFESTTTASESYAYETVTTQYSDWVYGAMRPTIFRRLVPTAVARGWALRVGFSMRWAGAFFSTAGLHLTYRALRTKAGGA